MSSESIEIRKRRSVSFHTRKRSVPEFVNTMRSRRHSIAVPKRTETETRKLPVTFLDDDADYQDYISFGSREIYRHFQFELHKEKAREKDEQKKDKSKQKRGKDAQKDEGTENENKLISFIVFIATEHENLMQLLIFSPLIIMSAYILFIEQGDLYHFVNEKGR